MPYDSEILRRVEEVLDAGRAPEEVCADAPDLLSAVRERLEHILRLDARIEELFPTPGPAGQPRGAPRATTSTKLPDIPGYVVERVLGHGGMGIVYLAMHIRLKRPVAIKMMLVGPYASEHDRARFMREAEAIAALQHPNIVQVHDVGEFDDRLYFSMEFVKGGNLAERLAGTPLPAREAAALIIKLADAVQVAHDGGVVHRDLKPGNVLLSADGTPKITDFGLARRIDGDGAMTLTGVRIGTPSYMAPEQVTGGENSIAMAVDIYALGAILYELLTGRPPLRAETASETERQLLVRDPVPPSRLNAKVPHDLETICLKCLHKDPQRRYGLARELAEDLQRFLNHEPILARPVSRAERSVRWMQRHPKETALVTAALLLFVVALVAGVREWNRFVEQRAEKAKWIDRQAFIVQLEEEGRFTEARTILDRIPDGGSSDIRASIERAKAELDIVERLDNIRLNRGRFKQGGGFDYAEAAQAYATAFREAGLGTIDDAPAKVALRLASLPVRTALVSALDDWSACAMDDERAWVLSVAKAIDPDPWRDRVRDQAKWANLEHLADLAAMADVERQPVTIMVAMGTRWRRLGGDPTEFLLRVQRMHPNDFWVNFELGHLFGGINPQASIGFNRAAVAVRPNAAAPHFNLGIAFRILQWFEDARHHFERTIADDPNHTRALRSLAHELVRAERLDRAIDLYDRAFVLDSLDETSRNGWVIAHMRSGRSCELKAKWGRMLAESPTGHEIWDGYAELCLYLGDVEGYKAACAALLKQFGAATDARICERAGRACLLLPASDEQLRRATQLIDRALAAERGEYVEWAYPHFQVAKAIADYRAGDFERAIALLQGDVLNALPPLSCLVLAMSLNQHGDAAQARQRLDEAIALFDWHADDATNREAWMYHIVRREAEDLILGTSHAGNRNH